MEKSIRKEIRLNLEVGNSGDIRNGYLNTNYGPVSTDCFSEDTQFCIADYKNLDPIISNDSVDEIIFNKILNIINPSDLIPVLTHWNQKLKVRGVLKVSFVDIRRVARAIYSDQLQINQAHYLIFGNGYEGKSLVEVGVFRVVAKEIGFRIESIIAKDYFVSIEMTKLEKADA